MARQARKGAGYAGTYETFSVRLTYGERQRLAVLAEVARITAADVLRGFIDAGYAALPAELREELEKGHDQG